MQNRALTTAERTSPQARSDFVADVASDWLGNRLGGTLTKCKELETTTVTLDEIVYHRRVRVLDRAGHTSISEACRTFGISRAT